MNLSELHVAEIEREAAAARRIQAKIAELVEAIAAYPSIWGWGDGKGGAVLALLEQGLNGVGLSRFDPPRAKPLRKNLGQGVRYRVMERDGFKCCSCGVQTELTIDHRVPLAAGGTDDEDNLQTLCRTCNLRKGVRVD